MRGVTTSPRLSHREQMTEAPLAAATAEAGRVPFPANSRSARPHAS